MIEKVKPLLAILSPRDIPDFEKNFHNVDYIDKVWFKYMNIVDVHIAIEKYFKEHTEYTHLILVSDDGVLEYNHIAMLIADIKKYNFPVIGGVCLIDCLADDLFLAVTMNKVTNNVKDGVERCSYECLPNDFVNLNGIIKNWFNGNALLTLRRDVVENVGLTFPDKKGLSSYSEAGDLTLNFHINEKYNQYVDLRVLLKHYRFPLHSAPYASLVGKRPARIIEEPATNHDIPKVKPAKIIHEIPEKYKKLMDFYYGKQDSINICIVSEFQQDGFFQWHVAFNRISNSPKRYGSFFTVSREKGHKINVKSVVMNQSTISSFGETDSYWDNLRNADLVFVYCVRQDFDFNWEWYNLPHLAKKFMKPEAKMICQFDDEFSFFQYKFWDKPYKIMGTSIDKFFEENKILDVADAYFTVLDDACWRKYCNKPVYYMPLPHLFRYENSIVVPDVASSVYNFSKMSGIKLGQIRKPIKKVALMHHSLTDSQINDTLEKVTHPLSLSSMVFSNNSGENHKVNGDMFYSYITKKGYMKTLSEAYVSIDDNEGYNGWSRFVLESALACVPCIGSSKAVNELFPDLQVAHNDFEKQKQLVQKLLTNENFYAFQQSTGWIRAITKLSDANLVTKFLKIAICDLGVETENMKNEKIKENEPIEEFANLEQKDGNYRVLIGTTFCNEDHTIDLFMKSLKEIDYPKELIDLIWVENNSSDNSWEILQRYYEEFKDLGYHSVKLEQKPCKYYNVLKKAGIDSVNDGKTLYEYGIKQRDQRNDHLVSLWNSMMDEMNDGHDFFLFWFPDTLAKPDMIKRYISSLINHPECGWISGAFHWRFPRFKRENLATSPLHFGLESPTLKIDETHLLPPNYKTEWIFNTKQYGLPYNIVGATEEEVLRQRKIGDGIFEICCSGHVWMMPYSVVVKNKLRIRLHAVEAAYAAERDLNNLGLKMCCNAHVYLQHVSVDGKIYRHSLEEVVNEIKEMVKVIETKEVKTEVKELKKKEPDEDLKYLFIEFLVNLGKDGYSIPRRPASGSDTFDLKHRKIINGQQWDELYGIWKPFLDDEKVYAECLAKAQAINRELDRKV